MFLTLFAQLTYVSVLRCSVGLNYYGFLVNEGMGIILVIETFIYLFIYFNIFIQDNKFSKAVFQLGHVTFCLHAPRVLHILRCLSNLFHYMIHYLVYILHMTISYFFLHITIFYYTI